MFKVDVFQDPLLKRNYMRGSISIENISFSRNCDIKITNANSVTDASIWAMFIFKNSDTFETVEHNSVSLSNHHSLLWISFQVN